MGRRIGSITQQDSSYGDVDGLVEQFTTDNQVTFRRTSRDSLWLQYLAAFGDLDPARDDNMGLAGKTEAEQIAAAKLHFETAGQFEAGRRSVMPFGLRYTRDDFPLAFNGRRIGTSSGLFTETHPARFITDNSIRFNRRAVTDSSYNQVYAYDVSNTVDGSGTICQKEYTIINDKKYTWNQARDEAVARGGQLAMFKTQQELDDFNAYLDTIPGYGGGWVGYSDRDSEGTWKWVDGTSGGVTNWYGGEPNNGGGVEDYANVIEAWGHKWNDWHDVDSGQASANSYFFMQRIISTSRFTFITGSFTWPQAKADAEARGGRLACITSECLQTVLEQAYISQVGSFVTPWTTAVDKNFWLGASDDGTDFTWVNGVVVGGSNYSNWYDGEPNRGHPGTNAITIGMRPDGRWNDASETSGLLGYVLETFDGLV